VATSVVEGSVGGGGAGVGDPRAYATATTVLSKVEERCGKRALRRSRLCRRASSGLHGGGRAATRTMEGLAVEASAALMVTRAVVDCGGVSGCGRVRRGDGDSAVTSPTCPCLVASAAH